jgi:carbamoyl-phosphate synthase large subunit
VIVRPSYVLGGRAMKIVYDRASLGKFHPPGHQRLPEHPVLIDKFLEDAVEVDVDAISDGKRTVIGGIMEHIEEAGVHSGRFGLRAAALSMSAAVHGRDSRPPPRPWPRTQCGRPDECAVRHQGRPALVLEVNPRASRTVPFVSKATGVPLAKLATKVMLGKSLDDLGLDHRGRSGPCFGQRGGAAFDRFPAWTPCWDRR